MKNLKLIFAIICSFTLVVSCSKFEEMPEVSVNERINEKMDLYQNYLSSAQYGWKAYLLTKSGLQKNFSFKFNDKNRVWTTLEDNVNNMEESSYRLKYLQRPSLIFDTYSLLHKLADPDESIYNGERGEGMESDFEFSILKASENHIELKGLFNESKLILIRAKSEEDLNSTFKDNEDMISVVSKLRTYFKRTTIDGKEFEVDFNSGDRKFGLIEYIDGFPEVKESSFYVVGDEINFFNPIVLGNDTLKSLKDVQFNSEGYLEAKLGNATLKITEAIEPLYYDKTAVNRFWSSGRQLSFGYWVHEGVKDYLNEASIATNTGMNQQVIILGYNAGYDLLGYARNWSLSFGPAISKVIDTNTGLIKYTFLGTVGTMSHVASRNIAIAAARNYADTKGLYVIEKGASSYDLVTVTDARKWIRISPL